MSNFDVCKLLVNPPPDAGSKGRFDPELYTQTMAIAVDMSLIHDPSDGPNSIDLHF